MTASAVRMRVFIFVPQAQFSTNAPHMRAASAPGLPYPGRMKGEPIDWLISALCDCSKDHGPRVHRATMRHGNRPASRRPPINYLWRG
jgi:hypothetical protein